MKHLLVFPVLLFVAVSCAPKIQKIADRPGGCINGHCTNGPENKPTECGGAAKFNTLSGLFKTKSITSKDSGVTYTASYFFDGNSATFTQYCEKKDSGDFESPQIKSTYSVNAEVTHLKFNQPAVNEVKNKTFSCKAQLTGDVFELSVEGSCLVMKTGKEDPLYYIHN